MEFQKVYQVYLFNFESLGEFKKSNHSHFGIRHTCNESKIKTAKRRTNANIQQIYISTHHFLILTLTQYIFF